VSSVVGADNRPHKDIKMYATDMSISTDVEMTSVVGTPEGRIFMCGSQDGCLYELHYQEKEGWFGKRVQLINHSVGGVQTLFPKIMNKSDGTSFILISRKKVLNMCTQTVSSRWSRICLGIAFILCPTEARSRSIKPTAIKQSNCCKPSTIFINYRKTRLPLPPHSHPKILTL
jgi:hypothetical protein